MCTVSWIHSDDGYQLLCNRDEQDTRLRASSPRMLECDGVRYVAPLDGDFGGSWIAVNEFGVTLALLNRAGFGARATRSRGLLVRELAGAQSLDELRETMTGRKLAPFAGFALVAVEPGHSAALFEWNSQQLAFTQDAEHRMPLTSSSFDPEGAEVQRRLEFQARVRQAGRVNADVLFQFHQSHGLHGDRPSAYTPCMHRAGAHTVSFSWVNVSASGVSLFYSPAAPCQWAPGETVRLARNVSALASCG